MPPTKLKTAPCSCSHGEKKETKKPVTKQIKVSTKAPPAKLQNKLTMEAVRAYKKKK